MKWYLFSTDDQIQSFLDQQKEFNYFHQTLILK